MVDSVISDEFLVEDFDTEVLDPDTSVRARADSCDERATLCLRDADRIRAFERGRIARSIRESRLVMNPDMLAALVESGSL